MGVAERGQKAGEQLPPELGRLRWMAVHFDGAEAGLLFERARRQNLLTAVISVSGGDRFVFSGPDEQAAQIFHWGEVLGAMATEGSGLRRLQWVERATPQPSTVQEDWARGSMREVSASEWADYQSLASRHRYGGHPPRRLPRRPGGDGHGDPRRRAGRGGERAGPAVRTPDLDRAAPDGALAPGDRGGDAPVGRSDRARAPGAVGFGVDPDLGGRAGGPPPRLRHTADRRLCPPGGPDRGLAPHRRGHRVDVPTALDRVAGFGAHGVGASRSGLDRSRP